MIDDRARAQIEALTRRVEALERALGRPADGFHDGFAAGRDPVEARALELLRAGRKIEAVKVYREATGIGLAEAKDAVDRIEAADRL